MLLILQIALGIVLAIIILSFITELLTIGLLLGVLSLMLFLIYLVIVYVPNFYNFVIQGGLNGLLLAGAILLGLILLCWVLGKTLDKNAPMFESVWHKFTHKIADLWRELPLCVRNALQVTARISVRFLLYIFPPLWLLSDKSLWGILIMWILLVLFVYFAKYDFVLSDDVTLIKDQWGIVLVISSCWIIISISAYFLGIWLYPSFLTNVLSKYYLWFEAAPIVDHGINFTPHYPLVNLVKLTGLVFLPIFIGWPVFHGLLRKDKK